MGSTLRSSLKICPKTKSLRKNNLTMTSTISSKRYPTRILTSTDKFSLIMMPMGAGWEKESRMNWHNFFQTFPKKTKMLDRYFSNQLLSLSIIKTNALFLTYLLVQSYFITWGWFLIPNSLIRWFVNLVKFDDLFLRPFNILH